MAFAEGEVDDDARFRFSTIHLDSKKKEKDRISPRFKDRIFCSGCSRISGLDCVESIDIRKIVSFVISCSGCLRTCVLPLRAGTGKTHHTDQISPKICTCENG